MPSPLAIVGLNTGARDAVFAPVRAIPGVALTHVEYRVSWEEISARRAGRPLPAPEPIGDDLRAALASADVVFGFVIPRGLPALAPHCRWVATPATGIDHLRGTGVLEAGLTVTTAAGLFGGVIAEHVFAGMLHFARRLADFEQQRRERRWQMGRIAALEGRTVGLVGVGAIGAAVAGRAKAFGMQTIGLARTFEPGRTVPGVDRLLPREELPALLAAADHLVLAVADTPVTRGMIGARELALLRPTSVLINVARGSIVDEAALIDALQAGRLAGAALDVFATEPLPENSPLWTLDRVLITPHVATNVEDYLPRAVAVFAADVRRWLQGEPLAQRLDVARGY